MVPVEDRRELLKRKHFDKMCPGVDASLKADLMTEQRRKFLVELYAACTVFVEERSRLSKLLWFLFSASLVCAVCLKVLLLLAFLTGDEVKQ